MELIHARELSVGSRLKSLSLNVNTGEVLGVIGPNGAGKSTLLHALAGLIDARGELIWQQQTVKLLKENARARLRAFMPQQLQLQWQLSVQDAVNLGRAPFAFGDSHFADAALAACNLGDKRNKSVHELSGGEQARVHLARALATQAPILLADEPLASLDFLYQKQILQHLRDYADAGRAVVLSIHDLSMAARFCDRLCLLKDGELIALGTPTDVLTEALLQKAYGVAVAVDLNASPPLVAVR